MRSASLRWIGLMVASTALWACASDVATPDLRVPDALPRVEATTSLGTVRGVEEGSVFAFYGVPYAAPVAGLDRFLPPRAPAPFSGTFDATRYGPACAQVEAVMPAWLIPDKTERYMAYVGVADVAAQPKGPECLNLNLWTPALSPDAPAPVMVFLHGGGLNQGSNRAAYAQGANMAAKGVVVVNINYRLGAQGFLAGGEGFDGDVLVPNRGIMDMVAALRWVRAHIGSFGGDRERVTVVGESGGGFAVWALLSSPSADGLLHRAIVHSAPPVMTPATDLQKVSRAVLDDLGVEPGDTAALAALDDEDIPHTLLSEAIMLGDDYGWLSQSNLPFNGAYGTDLIPQDTLPALAAGRASEVDLMVGVNKHEARGLSIMVPLPDRIATKITNSFMAGFVGPDDDARDQVRAGYETLLPNASGLELDEQILQDAGFRQPVIRAAEARARFGGSGRTYLWEFHWESPCCDGEVGAIHGLELAFAYDNLSSATMLVEGDPTAQPLATAMSDAWVSFAKTGVPTSPALPPWPVYDEQHRPTMIFDRESTIAHDLERERRLFWDATYAHQRRSTP